MSHGILQLYNPRQVQNLFSPNPASRSASLANAVVGTLSLSVLAKQTNLCVHEDDFGLLARLSLLVHLRLCLHVSFWEL